MGIGIPIFPCSVHCAYHAVVRIANHETWGFSWEGMGTGFEHSVRTGIIMSSVRGNKNQGRINVFGGHRLNTVMGS